MGAIFVGLLLDSEIPSVEAILLEYLEYNLMINSRTDKALISKFKNKNDDVHRSTISWGAFHSIP